MELVRSCQVKWSGLVYKHFTKTCTGALCVADHSHVEDVDLIDHETCHSSDTHLGHGHDHDHDHDHDCGSDKKVTGTQNKILQGEISHTAFVARNFPLALRILF